MMDLTNVTNEIKSDDIYDILHESPTADPNIDYYIMHEAIIRAKNKYMPSKLVKFNKHKHKKSTWITQGLLI